MNHSTKLTFAIYGAKTCPLSNGRGYDSSGTQVIVNGTVVATVAGHKPTYRVTFADGTIERGYCYFDDALQGVAEYLSTWSRVRSDRAAV
jgi:hypothetical protein